MSVFELLLLGGLDPDSHEYVKGDALLEATLEDFLKGDPALTYPSEFIKGNAFLEAWRFPYMKGTPGLQSLSGLYVKGDTVAQRHVELFISGVVTFLGGMDFGEFLKSDTALAAHKDSYLRGDAVFNVPAQFVKGTVALVRAPNLEELGPNPPATKPGVLSRQYLSVAAVKKEV